MVRSGLVVLGVTYALSLAWGGAPPKAPVERKAQPVVNTLDDLRAAVVKLKPLQIPLDKPLRGDWLTEHQEPGQTFEQFVKRYPEPTPAGLSTLYIQPIGDFGATQQKLVDTTARCLGMFYGRPVKTLPTKRASWMSTG